MRQLVRILMFGVALALGGSRACGVDGVRVRDLRCEYLVNPLGIDVKSPRLSWILESDQRGQRQTAYQVLVASSKENLSDGKGDLWDSGKVESDQSIHVVYEGKPLKSYMRSFWKVRVWGMDGRTSPWSTQSFWSMGILDSKEWRAKWLGYAKVDAQKAEKVKVTQALTFKGCQWIWFPEGDPREKAPECTRYFRRVFNLPADAKIQCAYILIAVDEQFTLYVNGKQAGKSDGKPQAWRQADQIEVSEYLAAGQNVLAVEARNTSPGPAGVSGRLIVQPDNGERIIVNSDGSWKTSDRKVAGWETVNFTDADWAAARELGQMGVLPWGDVIGRSPEWGQTAPSPLFRKTFTLDKPIKSATIYICGLGYYELRLNGRRIGDHVLDPAFTRYDKRVLYVTHDVTDKLTQGINAIGVMLGNGWYNMHANEIWNFHHAPWRDHPKMLAQLRIVFDDDTTETIASDSSWKAAAGPVILDGIQNGEIYDARLELPWWDAPGFDDSKWAEPAVVDAPKGNLVAQMMPPIKVTQTLVPVKMTEPEPGVFVFDMGQNFAGWTKLTVSGPAGTKVTLRYGERLSPEGAVYQEQIRVYHYQGPFQTDAYILKGKGIEVWEPRFTYHGFQYVEVRGFPGKPTLDNLRGRVVHTAFAKTGSFECSNDLLNTIQQLTLWSYRGNFHGYPTDCPQREKNGWIGDGHMAAEQAMYNFNNAASYVKWMNDIKDVQRDSGELPTIVPTAGWGYGGCPSGDSGYILIPWCLYQYYGDKRILADHYPGMKRYLDYLTRRSNGHIADFGLPDWNIVKTATPVGVTSTGYYYIDTVIVSQVARLLGDDTDAKKYAELAEKIRSAFNQTYFKGNGLYANGSQTALSCALYQGLVAPEEKARVVEQLVNHIQRQDWHADTGIPGTKYLFHALTDNGRTDVAYRIATQTTPPSYGDWIAKGATTLWEDWPGSGSLNHIMFGDISAWFYQALAGIKLDAERVAFKHIILRPQPVGDLSWVEAEHESMFGRIRSAWQISGNAFRLGIVIPANTTATVYLPARSIDDITESQRPIRERKDVALIRMEGNEAVLAVGSGRYQFVSRLLQ